MSAGTTTYIDDLDHAQAGRAHRLLPRLVVALVLLLALAGAVLTTIQADRSAGLADARAEALDAARTRVPLLLSYEHATLADDLDRALAQTTGAFEDDYRKILGGVVAPTAGERRISTSAAVQAAGVVPDGDDADRVVVLLFLTQTSTAGDGAPTVTGSRVEVTMLRAGSVWKIAGLEPV